jgi:hypothetical protein
MSEIFEYILVMQKGSEIQKMMTANGEVTGNFVVDRST